MTKKKKIILYWLLPISALTISIVSTTSFILVKNNLNNKILKTSLNIKPKINNDLENSNLRFNPTKFDVNFFVNKISLSNDFSKIFIFNQTTWDEKQLGWKNKEGIIYKVKKINSYKEDIENNSFIFDVLIEKQYKNNYLEYNEKILISKTLFANSSDSQKEFLSIVSKKINQLFANEDLQFKLKSNENIETNKDLELSIKESKNNDYYFETHHLSENEIKYVFKNDDFNYLGLDYVSILPVVKWNEKKLILNSNEAFFYENNVFNTNNDLYSFLNSNSEKLPTWIQQDNNSIKNLIFNPDIYSYHLDTWGNKVPNHNFQSIVLKLELNNEYVYLVVWSNLLRITSSLIESAPEIEPKLLKDSKGNTLLYSDLINEKSYIFNNGIKSNINFKIDLDQNNVLQYDVINVEFANEDIWKKNAIVTIQISHPSISTKKQYQLVLNSGFKSLAYFQLENQIKQLTNLNDLSKIDLIIEKKEQSNQVIKDNISELDVLETLLNIKSKLTNAKYKIDWAQINNGNVLNLGIKISSINDLENYWTYNGVVQIFEVSLKLE
ncbi:MAG: hypothetical protein IKG09_02440 [Mycoplasmataceae bacterium]|nr:hypothetical protein [Mycoplasmataceae bacterium]